MRAINDIVIHCSDSPDGRDDSIEDINEWHKKRFPPSESGVYCGYHWVIRLDGKVESGRLINEVGAHCPPNGKSIGICLIGTDKFKQAQWDSLRVLVERLKKEFPQAAVTGHRDHESGKKQGKTCPNFDVAAWAKTYEPNPNNILQ